MLAVGTLEQKESHGLHTRIVLVVEQEVLIEYEVLLLPAKTLSRLLPQVCREREVVLGLVRQVYILVLVVPQTTLHLSPKKANLRKYVFLF